MKNANKAIGPARSALGAPMRDGKPVVTIAIIGICAVMFVIQLVAPGAVNNLIFAPFVGLARPWTFITYAFLHGGVMHILFNMYALWVVGSYLEQMLGRWRYIALFLLSALGGSVAVLLLASPANATWVTPTLGASGGIFGLFATILMVTKRLGQDARGIYAVIGINVVFSFIAPQISWQGHMGGLITGLVLGGAYAFVPRKQYALYSVLATAAVAVALIALIGWKYAAVGVVVIPGVTA